MGVGSRYGVDDAEEGGGRKVVELKVLEGRGNRQVSISISMRRNQSKMEAKVGLVVFGGI